MAAKDSLASLFGAPGVGGTLFGGGGGDAGSDVGSASAADFQSTPGATKKPSHGKNSHQQNLHSPHSGIRQSITEGDPLSRSMSQYGKGHSYGGLGQIRGGKGGMKRIRGGLGPGKQGQAGPSDKDYSMKSADTE